MQSLCTIFSLICGIAIILVAFVVVAMVALVFATNSQLNTMHKIMQKEVTNSKRTITTLRREKSDLSNENYSLEQQLEQSRKVVVRLSEKQANSKWCRDFFKAYGFGANMTEYQFLVLNMAAYTVSNVNSQYFKKAIEYEFNHLVNLENSRELLEEYRVLIEAYYLLPEEERILECGDIQTIIALRDEARKL